MKSYSRVRTEGVPRRRRLRIPPPPAWILVWCTACERFIAHEDKHHCQLEMEEMAWRRAKRIAKAKELMERWQAS